MVYPGDPDYESCSFDDTNQDVVVESKPSTEKKEPENKSNDQSWENMTVVNVNDNEVKKTETPKEEPKVSKEKKEEKKEKKEEKKEEKKVTQESM